MSVDSRDREMFHVILSVTRGIFFAGIGAFGNCAVFCTAEFICYAERRGVGQVKFLLLNYTRNVLRLFMRYIFQNAGDCCFMPHNRAYFFARKACKTVIGFYGYYVYFIIRGFLMYLNVVHCNYLYQNITLPSRYF